MGIFRLKLGNGLQYKLNAKGSTPAEVLGIDYKSTLQPALASLAEGVKNSSMEKLEEQISLERLQFENAAKIEAKRNHIAALESRIDKVSIPASCLYIYYILNTLKGFDMYTKLPNYPFAPEQ